MKILISISTLTRSELTALKKNPVDYAQSLTKTKLVQILKDTKNRYHDRGTSPISDEVYDVLKDELRSRSPNHPLLKEVGATPTGRKKVRLPYPLFSLNKIKPGEKSFDSWVGKHKGPYVVSDKEDGLSLEVIYKKGLPIAVYTRGNGTVGQDVTHLIPNLGIPLKITNKEEFVVRMEVAMKDAVFNKHFSKKNSKSKEKTYENPRNLVAGVVNTIKKSHEALNHLHHIAYEIIEPRMKPSSALKLLAKLKFNVVPHTIMNELDPDKLVKFLELRKKKSHVGLDGLVIEQDKVTKRSNSENPDYAVAFKAELEGDVVETKVIGVVWQTSKHGKLVPVVMVDPVRLAGVTVKRASGFNAKFIETGWRLGDKGKSSRPIGKDAVIKIKRSNEVIPFILEVVKPAKRPDMPTVPYKYSDTGVDIYLKENTDEVRAKRITQFFVKIGVENIKQGTIEQLIEEGYDSIIKILKMKPNQFLQLEGFQERKANKLYQSIHDKVGNVIPLETLMAASGHFGIGMGERRIAEILKYYPNILDIYEQKGRTKTKELILGIKSFQEKTATVFLDGIPGYLKWVARSGLKTSTTKKVKAVGSALKGIGVAFTGFRDKKIEELIVQQGGTITNGITSNSNLLLVKDKSSGSSKIQKAQERGIKIYTVDEFKRKYKL